MPSMSQPDRDLVEVFSFLSGLYFRVKLAYAQAFARPPPRLKTGALVITTKPSVSASTLRHARKALSDPLSEDLNISPEPKLPLQQVDTAGLIKMTVTATRERNNRRSQRADHTRELRDVGGHCWSEGANCAVVIC
jgi:hypothetical protein